MSLVAAKGGLQPGWLLPSRSEPLTFVVWATVSAAAEAALRSAQPGAPLEQLVRHLQELRSLWVTVRQPLGTAHQICRGDVQLGGVLAAKMRAAGKWRPAPRPVSSLNRSPNTSAWQTDKLAAPHSITTSARASSKGAHVYVCVRPAGKHLPLQLLHRAVQRRYIFATASKQSCLFCYERDNHTAWTADRLVLTRRAHVDKCGSSLAKREDSTYAHFISRSNCSSSYHHRRLLSP